MQGTSSRHFDPNTPSMTVSPLSMRQVYCTDSASSCVSPLNNMASVTPHSNRSSKMTMEQWMAARGSGLSMQRSNMGSRTMTTMNRGGSQGSGHSSGSQVSPNERMEVTRAVYGLLRDNLPPSLESQTSPDVLVSVAESIETKLHSTATSRRAYCSLSTLEFRIKALATAVLIHADREHYERHNGVSDTCVRLSAVTRTSLAYCVMVLVEFEKERLNKIREEMMMNMMMMNRRQGRQGQQQGRQQQQQGLRRRTDNRWDDGQSSRQNRLQQQEMRQQQQQQQRGDGNEYRQLARRAAQLVEYERMAHAANVGNGNDDSEGRAVNVQIAKDDGSKKNKRERTGEGNSRRASFCVPTAGY